MSNYQIRTIFYFNFKLNISVAETIRQINFVWGNNTVGDTTLRRWFKKFTGGNYNFEDEPRSGRPSIIDKNELKILVESDTSQPVRVMGNILSVGKTTVADNLIKIGKKKKLDKLVPHELNDRQKLKRYEICPSLLLRNQKYPFLNRIITCDEKWISYDNRTRLSHWVNIEDPPLHFSKLKTDFKKTMVTIWWSATGVIHYSFLEPGKTITAISYCEEIDKMYFKLNEQHLHLMNSESLIILHDNARPHISQLTAKKLNELHLEVLPHPPYSPDLSPTDYHVFKHLQNYLNGQLFINLEQTKKAFINFIESRDPGFWIDGINRLVNRWEKCIDANGFYFN